MLYTIFFILKVIGAIIAILVGIILFIVAAVIFVPVNYSFSLDKDDTGDKRLQAFVRINWGLRWINFKAKYIDGNFTYNLIILGMPFKVIQNIAEKIKKIKSKKRKKRHNKKKTYSQSDEFSDYEENDESFEIQADESGEYEKKAYSNDTSDKTAKKSTAEKIKDVFIAIIQFPVKVAEFIKNLMENIVKIFEKASDLIWKASVIKEFLSDRENEEGFKTVRRALKGTINHIKPSKFDCQILFGTGNPASTGQLLGLIAMTSMWHGEYIKIAPDFDRKIFNSHVYAKGKIRIINLLVIYMKLYFDDSFKQLLSSFNKLKEEIIDG